MTRSGRYLEVIQSRWYRRGLCPDTEQQMISVHTRGRSYVHIKVYPIRAQGFLLCHHGRCHGNACLNVTKPNAERLLDHCGETETKCAWCSEERGPKPNVLPVKCVLRLSFIHQSQGQLWKYKVSSKIYLMEEQQVSILSFHLYEGRGQRN